MTSRGPRRQAKANIIGGLIHLLAEMGAVAFMLGLLAIIAWLLLTIS